MVKKLFLRLASSLGMMIVVTVATQGIALANPSKVSVSVSYKPWNSAITQAISDVGVNIQTVNDAGNGIPRNDSSNPVPANRIYTRDGVNCPTGCHLGVNYAFGQHPTTNNYSFSMASDLINDGKAVGFGGTVPNVLAPSGSTTRLMQLPEFAWCVGLDANNNPIYHFQTTLTGNVDRSPNGGTWRAYWRWTDATETTAYRIGDGTGTSLVAPANNGNVTQVIFVYEENSPQSNMTFSGTKTDEVNFAGGGPYTGAEVSLDGGTKKDTNNPYSIGSVRADQPHTLTAAAVPGFTLIGYKKNGGSLVASTTYSYAANDVADGASVTIDWIYRANITGLLTITCDTVGVSVAGPSGVSTNVTIEGEDFGDSANITIPERLKDGRTRQVRLNATYHGQAYNDIDVRNHSCPNDAQCISTNVPAVIGANADVGGQGYTLQVTMKNSGQSTWDGQAAGRHHLTLDAATSPYWSVAEGSLGVTEQNPRVAGSTYQTTPGTSYIFSFRVVLNANVQLSNSIPLNFRMAADTSPSTTDQQFGQSCNTTVRPRNYYYPWLRVQNGSVSALEKIIGQAEGSRGFRKSEPVQASPGDDFNKDAQYAVVSAVNSVNLENRFCSTNAYTYGRGDTIGSCTFAGYAFTVGGMSRADYQNTAIEDPVVKQALAMASYRTCTNATYNANKEDLRTFATADKDGDSPANNPFPYGVGAPTRQVNLMVDADHKKCGIMTRWTSGTGTVTFGNTIAGPPSNGQITQGRATWVIEGNLYINSNIVNGTTWTAAPINGDITEFNVIPNLGLIVQGNVIIGKDVTRIDATIYAGGTISTCSAYQPAAGADSGTQCGNPLLIKGGLSARGGFLFGRTYFNRNVGRAPAAADFDYIPILAGQSQGPYSGGPAEEIIGNGISYILPPPGLEDYVSGYYKAKYIPVDLSPRF